MIGTASNFTRARRIFSCILMIAALSIPPLAYSQSLRNDDIVSMVQAKISDSVIIAKIKTSPSHFDTSPTALIQSKKSGVSDVVLQAMTEAATGGSTRADKSAPSAVPSLPGAFGVYLADGLAFNPLQMTAVETRIGLVAGATIGGTNGYAVDGFAGDPLAKINGAASTIIVYEQNVDTSALHLSPLVFVSTMRAYEFNILGTQPAFFRNVYGRNYNDIVQVGLWRPNGEIPVQVEPVAAKPGMYKLLPNIPLAPGKYALYKTGAVHDQKMIFASPSGRRSNGYYFEVGTIVPAIAASAGSAETTGNSTGEVRSPSGAESPVDTPTVAPKQFTVSHRHIVLFAAGPVNDQCSGTLSVARDGSITYACTQADSHGRCDKFTFFSGTFQAQVRRGGNLHLVASKRPYDFYGDTSIIQEAYVAISSPSPAQPGDMPASATGRYLNDNNSDEYLDLRSDETFELGESGKIYSGSYQMSGTTLILNMKTMNGRPVTATSTGKLDGKMLTDDEGKRWTKQP